MTYYIKVLTNEKWRFLLTPVIEPCACRTWLLITGSCWSKGNNCSTLTFLCQRGEKCLPIKFCQSENILDSEGKEENEIIMEYFVLDNEKYDG